jgi:hypothetical protein
VRSDLYLGCSCIVVVLACCGCSEAEYTLAKVSGKVTKAGQPVSGAVILFQPMASTAQTSAGPGSSAITDAEGRYELKTYKEKKEGAVIGRHRVTINLPLPPGVPDDGAVDPSLMSPIRFRDGSVQVDVPRQGLDSIHFELNQK